MKEIAYLSTAYLAPVEYYLALLKFPIVKMEMHEHYIKQTYRNRCIIASANGVMPLTVPVIKQNNQPICDVRISDHGNWRHLHWHAIMSAYRSSPYFEYYEDDFAPFYEREYEFLTDFNQQLQDMICGFIDFTPNVELTQGYVHEVGDNESDLRNAILPGKISSTYQPYWQVFEEKYGFQPNLSIIDLLFNMGPESLLYLMNHDYSR